MSKSLLVCVLVFVGCMGVTLGTIHQLSVDRVAQQKAQQAAHEKFEAEIEADRQANLNILKGRKITAVKLDFNAVEFVTDDGNKITIYSYHTFGTNTRLGVK